MKINKKCRISKHHYKRIKITQNIPSANFKSIISQIRDDMTNKVKCVFANGKNIYLMLFYCFIVVLLLFIVLLFTVLMYVGKETVAFFRRYTNQHKTSIVSEDKMPRFCARWCRWQCATIFILSLILSFIFIIFISPLPSRPRLAVLDLLPRKDRIGKGIKYLLLEAFKIRFMKINNFRNTQFDIFL